MTTVEARDYRNAARKLQLSCVIYEGHHYRDKGIVFAVRDEHQAALIEGAMRAMTDAKPNFSYAEQDSEKTLVY